MRILHIAVHAAEPLASVACLLPRTALQGTGHFYFAIIGMVALARHAHSTECTSIKNRIAMILSP